VSDKQENNILTEDVQRLEATLRGLWGQTKQAAEMIQSLRDQKRDLLTKVDELEAKVNALQTKLEQREEEVQLVHQQLQEARRNGLGVMDQEERDELRNQIIGLLDKINSHL